MYSARLGRDRPRRQRGGAGRAGEVPDHQVGRDRVAQVRRVTGAFEGDQPGLRDGIGDGRPAGWPDDGVRGALQDQGRAAHLGAEAEHGVRVVQPGCVHAAEDDLGGGLQAPADPVLNLLGRVRLGEHLGDEEVQESRPVAEPVAAVPLGPSGESLRFPLEGERALLLSGVRGQQQVGRDQHEPADQLRVLGGQEHVFPGAAPGHDDRLLDAHVVQDGPGVVGGGPPVVRGHFAGPVRAPVAAPVEGDHPGVPGEVRNLGFPGPGVGDLPGGKQQDGGLAGAVHLVEHADAVPLQVALGVGIARPRLLAPHRHIITPGVPGPGRVAASPGPAGPGDTTIGCGQLVTAAPRTRG